MLSSGFKIAKTFDAGHGLMGYIISKGADGPPHVVYVTADGQALMIGELRDSGGKNLTQSALSEFNARPDLEPVYRSLETSTFVETGQHDNPKRTVYVLFDPNCPFCAAGFQALQGYKGSSVRLRWVPVAYLQPDSAARAAAILEASDPAAALAANEMGFDAKDHKGGLKPAESISEKTSRALKANGALMDKLGSTATPTWIYQDNQGRIQVKVGLPEPVALLDILGASAP
jgi:thiol:disulfide interchange protein DsbG